MKRIINSNMNTVSEYTKRDIEYYDKIDMILIDDNILYITTFLCDREKIKFLSITKRLHLLKNRIYYNELIDVDRIYEVSYYDKFKNIQISGYQIYTGVILPKFITQLTLDTFCGIEDVSGDIDGPIKRCISNSLTHLTFGRYFNRDIKGCIPNSVTHLTFGYNFNQNIKDCIPNSVTHLTFGFSFDQNIKDCIPNSVTHLTFDFCFNQYIKDCIPNSVTHLTLGWYFNKDIMNCIPTSVIKLSIPHHYNKMIALHDTCKIIRYS